MVKINDKYYISATTNYYSLKEKKIIQDKESENYGKEQYFDIGFYSSIESCLNGLLKKQCREFLAKEDIKSIEEFKKFILEKMDYIKKLDLKF